MYIAYTLGRVIPSRHPNQIFLATYFFWPELILCLILKCRQQFVVTIKHDKSADACSLEVRHLHGALISLEIDQGSSPQNVNSQNVNFQTSTPKCQLSKTSTPNIYIIILKKNACIWYKAFFIAFRLVGSFDQFGQVMTLCKTWKDGWFSRPTYFA